MSELPEGWAITSLGEIAVWGSGGTPSRSEPSFYGGSIPWIKSGELNSRYVKSTEESITEAAVSGSSAKIFPAGSVAIAMYGATIGKTAILGVDAATNQACAVGIPVEGLTDTDFLYRLLQNEKDAFIEKGKGGAQPNISQAVIKAHEISLPPLAEQTRIAAKLDELLAQVDTLKARIDGIPALLKRFRQSVLAAAVSGRLTEEWRWENQSGAWDNKTLAELSNRLHQGINTSADKVEYSEAGTPILQAKHITSGDILVGDARNVANDVFEKYREKYCPSVGSILFTNIGTIGRSVVVDKCTELLIAWNIFLIEPNAQVIPRYLQMNLELLRTTGYYESLYRGGATQFVNKKQLSEIKIPLPTIDEQVEVVRRVEQLFAFAEQLETKINAAKTRIDRLTQSILAKAFRGELVPQDPNDEPASALLERIKTQRAAAPKAKRGRKASA